MQFAERLSANNKHQLWFNTTNVVAQKSICQSRRSFTARNIVSPEPRRRGCLVSCELSPCSRSQHVSAPVLTASSSSASQYSRADFVPFIPTGLVQCDEYVGRENRRQRLCCLPKDACNGWVPCHSKEQLWRQ